MTFRERIVAAVERGLEVGVLLLMVVVVLLLGSGWVFGDYFFLRARVANICANAPQACEPPKPSQQAPAQAPKEQKP